MQRMKSSRVWLAGLLVILAVTTGLRIEAQAPASAPAPAAGVHYAHIGEADARRWLTYLSSDLLQGREVFTEGYGLAAAYVAEQLQQIGGVTPLGADGTYFQPVFQRDYRVTRRSTVTVVAAGVSRTFTDGDDVTFPILAGAPQTLTFDGVEFAGYGVPMVGAAPAEALQAGGKLVVYLPGSGAGGTRASRGAASVQNRSRALVAAHGARAVIAFVQPPPRPEGLPSFSTEPGPGEPHVNNLTTVRNVDAVIPPALTGDEAFFEFLFRGSAVSFDDLRARAGRGAALPAATLSDVSVTIQVHNDYDEVGEKRTENVVGMVPGTDPVLRHTYVFFGAHLDHVGYASGQQPPGRVNTPLDEDRVWNGADDDGSGSTAVLAIAKAFATGPKPRRSVVFVWHAGEEAGLLGSRYMADHPVVPLDAIEAELNIDMIGRNRDDDPRQINTVYVIGADRISTDLHNLLVETNDDSSRPLDLDFEYNDPRDPNSFYTRSDHYSYASKGIPIAFFFTGTHADYHANTDTVDKIIFPKLVRIAEFIYQAGFSLADTARVLERDNLGPRSGRGFHGLLPKAGHAGLAPSSRSH